MSKTKQSILFLIFSIILLSCGGSSKPSKTQLRDEMSGVWSSTMDEGLVEINFKKVGEEKINMGGVMLDVKIKQVDVENEIISFYVSQQGQSMDMSVKNNVIWSISEIYDEGTDSYTLNLITDQGEIVELDYFVREL